MILKEITGGPVTNDQCIEGVEIVLAVGSWEDSGMSISEFRALSKLFQGSLLRNITLTDLAAYGFTFMRNTLLL